MRCFKMRLMLMLLPLAAFLSSCKTASLVSGESYRLADTLRVEGRQGVATDGRYYYVSGSTALYKYDMQGRLLLTQDHPFTGLERECNHIGDIDVYQGELYAGCEYFMDGQGRNIQVVVYDAETLKPKYSIPWEPKSGQVECCGLAVDRDRQEVWMADWVQGHELYCYDLKTRRYKRKLSLSPAPKLQQGIYCLNGKMLISCDDGDAEFHQPDHLYQADLKTGKTQLWRTMDDFILTGEIEGLTYNPLNGQLVVMSNRGARIILGMPRGFYPGYTQEIHNLYIYDAAKASHKAGK
ncbi:MAG: hypothetical protein PUH21_00545 [Prevotellaceae bacterium]|nr:hypothetical protein [Prevotellaceae bacterium]MDY3856865.1 hypothetical protein [Bacteroidaceae bacterium]